MPPAPRLSRRWFQFNVVSSIAAVSWAALIIACVREMAVGRREVGFGGCVLLCIASAIWFVRNSDRVGPSSLFAGALGGSIGVLLAIGINGALHRAWERPSSLVDPRFLFFAALMLVLGCIPGAFLGFAYGVIAEKIRKERRTRTTSESTPPP